MIEYNEVCEDCEGRGTMYDSHGVYGQSFARAYKCPHCDGEGSIVKSTDPTTFWQGVMYTIIFFIALIAVGNAIELGLRAAGL